MTFLYFQSGHLSPIHIFFPIVEKTDFRINVLFCFVFQNWVNYFFLSFLYLKTPPFTNPKPGYQGLNSHQNIRIQKHQILANFYILLLNLSFLPKFFVGLPGLMILSTEIHIFNFSKFPSIGSYNLATPQPIIGFLRLPPMLFSHNYHTHASHPNCN